MNNNIVLNGCIEEFKKENELTINESEIFELFCLTQATKNFDITFDDLDDSIVDGGNDGGIDSIILILDDECIQSIDSIYGFKFSANTIFFKILISQAKTETKMGSSLLLTHVR